MKKPPEKAVFAEVNNRLETEPFVALLSYF